MVLDVATSTSTRPRAGTTGADADAAAIRALPLERVAYVHAAGGRERDGRLHDTHADPLWPEVDALVEELWARGDIGGDIGGVLLSATAPSRRRPSSGPSWSAWPPPCRVVGPPAAGSAGAPAGAGLPSPTS